MSVGSVLAKTAGVIGIGLIGYDAHCAGKMEASSYASNRKANGLSEGYKDHLKLDSPSVVKNEIKNELFDYNLNENLSGFFASIGGYIKGALSMAFGNIIPLGLSIATICTKGKASKFCGAGLAIYGGIYLAQELFGIGKTKE